MNRQFTITSPAFEGRLMLGYNDDGVLYDYFSDARLSEGQMIWLSANFPINLTILERVKAGSKTMVIIDTTVAPTFGDFWEKYAYKLNKIQSEKLWNKLTDDDKHKALHAIPGYSYYLMQRPNQDRQYPDTYLRKRTFNNDYAALVKK